MKIIGVVFSDLHYANWKQFNKDEKRIELTYKALNKVIKASITYKCPILFSGDLVDHPKWMENSVMKWLAKSCARLIKNKKTIYGINGNHDFYESSTHENRTEGYMTHLEAMGAPFTCVDYTHVELGKMQIHGIPYLNSNIGFIDALKDRVANRHKSKKNILLIHRDLSGAQEPDGKIVKKDKDGDEKIRKLFKKFDLVISGHIHRPQYIRDLGKHILMCGATNQQRRSDKDCKMGYWLIYEDMSTEFVDLEMPGFRFYYRGEEHEDTDDFWIELPKIEEIKKSKSGLSFKINSDKTALLKKYFKVKGFKSKRKLQKLMKIIHD